MSPREDPNEGPYPRVRESIEPVPGGSIDPVFGLALVLLRELLLEARQRISARLFQCVLAPRTQSRSPHSVSVTSVSGGRDRNVNDAQRTVDFGDRQPDSRELQTFTCGPRLTAAAFGPPTRIGSTWSAASWRRR